MHIAAFPVYSWRLWPSFTMCGATHLSRDSFEGLKTARQFLGVFEQVYRFTPFTEDASHGFGASAR